MPAPVPSHTPGQATVTAVALGTPYPTDSLFPSDSLFPDSTYLPVGPGAAVVVAGLGDAHLTATSSGGSILTSNGVGSAVLAAAETLASVQT